VIGAPLSGPAVNPPSLAAAGELLLNEGIAVTVAVLASRAPKCEVNIVLNKEI